MNNYSEYNTVPTYTLWIKNKNMLIILKLVTKLLLFNDYNELYVCLKIKNNKCGIYRSAKLNSTYQPLTIYNINNS